MCLVGLIWPDLAWLSLLWMFLILAYCGLDPEVLQSFHLTRPQSQCESCCEICSYLAFLSWCYCHASNIFNCSHLFTLPIGLQCATVLALASAGLYLPWCATLAFRLTWRCFSRTEWSGGGLTCPRWLFHAVFHGVFPVFPSSWSPSPVTRTCLFWSASHARGARALERWRSRATSSLSTAPRRRRPWDGDGGDP